MKMNTEKKLVVAMAVTAMTIGSAASAWAFESELHGMFRVRGIVSNFDDDAGGSQNTLTGSLAKSDPRTSAWVEQRARLLYTAKSSNDLKFVTHFEIDSRWGDNSYNSNNTTRNNGGGIGADQVNLETKNIYLDFNIPTLPVNVKLGIQNWGGDKYKGIIMNTDAAGVVVNTKLDKGNVNFTYFRFDDAKSVASTAYISGQTYNADGTGNTAVALGSLAAEPAGYRTRDFLSLGGKYEISKDLKVGADYFLLYSDIMRATQAKTNIHTFGVNAEYTFGDAMIDGFVLYQGGRLGTVGKTQTVSAFTANVGGRAKVGSGTARSNLLYVSGDSDPTSGNRTDFQVIMEKSSVFSAGNDFGAAEMQLMLDNKMNMVNSGRGVVYNLNNFSQGFAGAFFGYDLPFGGKYFVNSNIGFGFIAKDNSYLHAHSSNFLGTEINTEIGYKMYSNMTVSALGAYMVLGDYFKNNVSYGTATQTNPANPYSTKVMFNYTF